MRLLLNDPKLSERFWAKVDQTNFCWNWTGSKCKGYGQLRINKRNVYAHRFIYEAMLGRIPDGYQIDHLCRNSACVNVTHLEPVTKDENNRRGNSPAGQKSRQTHCKRGHPLSGDNLDMHMGKFRRCRACHREQENRARRGLSRNG